MTIDIGIIDDILITYWHLLTTLAAREYTFWLATLQKLQSDEYGSSCAHAWLAQTGLVTGNGTLKYLFR